MTTTSSPTTPSSIAQGRHRIRPHPLEEIGKTAEGRPIVMAIITAPANFKNRVTKISSASPVPKVSHDRRMPRAEERSSGSMAAFTPTKSSHLALFSEPTTS